MLDDERYPTVVTPKWSEDDEKIVSPEGCDEDSPPTYKTMQTFADAKSSRHAEDQLPVRQPAQSSGQAESQLPVRQPKRPWWKRPTPVLLMVLIVVISIGLGGAVIYVIIRNKSTADPPQTSNGTSSSNSTGTSSSGSTVSNVSTISNSTLNSVASSGLFLKDETTWNMQTYWQTSDGSIKYQVSLDGTTFSKAMNMSLSISAKIGSPLSATASTDTTGVVYLSLFYLTTSNKIAMAGSACPAGSSTCSSTTNSIISDKDLSVHNSTGLAAINVDNAQDWRIYYHDENNMVCEMGGNSSGFGTGAIIGGAALDGSSIAATNINATTNNINVFYIDNLTSALYTLEFTDDWSTSTAVSQQSVPAWNPLSGISACYSKVQDQIRTYYTGLDQKIYEFLGSKASTTETVWTPQPGQNRAWASADYVGADITAVGWNDQVRFFQISQNRLVEATLDNTTWTEAFVSTSSS